MKATIIGLRLASFTLGASAVLIVMSAVYEDKVSTIVAMSCLFVGMLILTATNFKILTHRWKRSEKENDLALNHGYKKQNGN